MKNKSKEKPEYTIEVDKAKKNKTRKVLIFTPCTGLLRVEWVQSRYGQIIPTNWSQSEIKHICSDYMPLEYQLADAQNLMALKVVQDDYDWVIFIEHDNLIPPDTFVKFNEYMNKGDVPIVSGLYFTRSDPPEPIVYRGRGNSHYTDWKMGDKFWVDGVPFGCLLMNASLIKEAWKESAEYTVGNQITRRVFDNTPKQTIDARTKEPLNESGTTDLIWCTRLMEKGLFKKAGWDKYQKMKNPFLVDSTIFVGHIEQNGRVYPLKVPDKFIPKKKKK